MLNAKLLKLQQDDAEKFICKWERNETEIIDTITNTSYIQVC